MKRAIVVVVALGMAAVATPWVIGWRTEHLVRARVAQVEADKAAKIRLRVDSYERGWRSTNAQISVIDRDGAPLVTRTAAIRALQNRSDAAFEFAFDARHLAKEPLGRVLDARASAMERKAASPVPTPGRPGGASLPEPAWEEMFNDLMRGSPAADLRFMLKAREGRVEIKLATSSFSFPWYFRSAPLLLRRRTITALRSQV